MSNIDDQELIRELERRFNENKNTLSEMTVLAEELKIANKKLEESEALKSHFISNITNEIQNPFASILGLAKNILSVKKEDWKTVISMISHIHTEAFNLDFQFRNIFMAAKIESGELIFEVCKVDILSLLHNLIDDFKFDAKKKNLDVQFTHNLVSSNDDAFYFKTDPEKLKLIMSNLISNATKFSHDKGQIEINASVTDSILTITVKDYGEGISEQNKEIIFDRFKRVDSGITSVNRGHGLGLSINKALIDFLNGNIAIDTKIGVGSLFTINIPESKLHVTGIATNDSELFFNDSDNEKGEMF